MRPLKSSNVIPAAGAGVEPTNAALFVRGQQELTRNFSAGDGLGQKFTLDFLVRRHALYSGSLQAATICGSPTSRVTFSTPSGNTANGGDNLRTYLSSSWANQIYTDALFRDIQGWYRITVAVDSTLSTASDRCKYYVNGKLVSKVNDGAQNLNWGYLHNGLMRIGDKTQYGLDASFDYFRAIDGAQVSPADIDAGNFSYGTNGFLLEFDNPANAGEDTADHALEDLTKWDHHTNTGVVSTFSNNYRSVNTGTTGRPCWRLNQQTLTGVWYLEFVASGLSSGVGLAQESADENQDYYYGTKQRVVYNHALVTNGTQTAMSGSAAYPKRYGIQYDADSKRMKVFDESGLIADEALADTDWRFVLGDGSGSTGSTVTSYLDAAGWTLGFQDAGAKDIRLSNGAKHFAKLDTRDTSGGADPGDFSEGNLRTNIGASEHCFSTLAFRTPIYFETTINSVGNVYIGAGYKKDNTIKYIPTHGFGVNKAGDIYGGNNLANSHSNFEGLPGISNGDIIGCYIDPVNRLVWWSRNGQWYSGDTAGESAIALADVEAGNRGFNYTAINGTDMFVALGSSSTAANTTVNFGQKPFQYPAPVKAGKLALDGAGYIPQNHFSPTGFDSNSFTLAGLGFQNLNAHFPSTIVLGDGNLRATDSVANRSMISTTLTIPNTGKWFLGRFYTTTSSHRFGVYDAGVIFTSQNPNNVTNRFSPDGSVQASVGGSAVIGSPSWSASSYTDLYADMDQLKVGAVVDGVDQGFVMDLDPEVKTWGVFVGDGSNGFALDVTCDFGQRGAAGPFGYKPVTQANLPIVHDPSDYTEILMDVGNGGNKTVTGQMDNRGDDELIIRKPRSIGSSNWLWGSKLLGETIFLSSNLTTALRSLVDSFTAFGATGFSVGASASVNGAAYINYRLRTGPHFQMKKYTGTGANRVLDISGFGWDSPPEMVIIKRLDVNDHWVVYHKAIGPGKAIYLNYTIASFDIASGFLSNPTSAGIEIGSYSTINAVGGEFILFAFRSIPGLCDVFDYTGNGSSDGVFIPLTGNGLVIRKSYTHGDRIWAVTDTARDPDNQADKYLRLENNTADEPALYHDNIVGGLKERSASGGVNSSGVGYIGLALHTKALFDPTSPKIMEAR